MNPTNNLSTPALNLELKCERQEAYDGGMDAGAGSPGLYSGINLDLDLSLLKNVEDADRTLHDLTGLYRCIQAIEAEAEMKINLIMDEKLAGAKPILEKIKNLEDKLTVFLEMNKDSIVTEDKRSVELNFGTIGFRESTKIKINKKETLKLLEQYKFTEAIKNKPVVNKEAMKSWSDGKLAMVKAKKETKDLPFYETNEFSIKDLA